MIRKKAANIVKWSPKPARVGGGEAGPAEERRAAASGRAERRSCSTNATSSDDADRVGGERRGGRPAVGVAARRRPHDAEQAAAREREAGQVERHLRAAALGQAARGERGGRQADRDVDPEDPVPVERLDDDAAEQRPERDADAGDRRPQAERGRAALGREGGRQQRQRERHEQRGAEALDGACDDELREVVRERAGGRGGREDEQPDDEHAPPAVAVAERGAGQDEDGERRGCTRRRPTAGGRARRRDRAASTAASRARSGCRA